MATYVTDGVEKSIERSTTIDAPVEQVWALVSDLAAMSRWSPQCRYTHVFGGETKQGATALNINRRGLLHWPTQSKVVRFDENAEIAFRIKENQTTWYYRLEPAGPDGAATRLTAGRDARKGTLKLSAILVDKVLGGQEDFTAELKQGLEQTLSAIKTEAEAGAGRTA